MSKKIAVLIGSLRKESISRKVAQTLITLAPQSIQSELIEIGDLPLYNQDFDDEQRAPATWTQFRNKMSTFDGVLFVTPEYNRSVPAVLKNAIDVGSRPWGQSIWSGKPAAVVSLSVGPIGGFGANQHLKSSLHCLNMPILAQPEMYIGQAGALFNEQNKLVRDDTQQFFKSFMDTFAHWVELNKLAQ
jgi:chromate reductase